MLRGDDVAFEALSEALASGDKAESVELASGRRVLVLSLEDMLLWRLRSPDDLRDEFAEPPPSKG